MLRLQIGAMIVGLSALHAMPPERGRILLVPMTLAARMTLARDAVAGGALLIAAGPVPGSLVVQSDRPRFLHRMVRVGVLPLAALPAGCGSSRGPAA